MRRELHFPSSVICCYSFPLREIRQRDAGKFRSFFRSVEPWRIVELLSIQVVRHGGDRLPFDVLALVKILPCRLNGRVSQDPLNNVERRPFLHQPRCQCVPQSMRINLFDLTSL